MKKKLMPIFGCAFLVFLILTKDCRSQIAKTLYLSSDSAKKLLKAAEDYGTKEKQKKIVFQFYLNLSNELTLYAWPKKRDDDANNDNDKVVLDIGGGKEIKLNGMSIILANLSIGPNRINKISKVLKKYKFLIFEPDTKEIDKSAICHLYYNIFGTTETVVDLSRPLIKTRITDTQNPSPPRQVD